MRKFNFNSFKSTKETEAPKRKDDKKHFSAYRTVLSRHEDASARLRDEPIAVIKNP